MNDLVAFWALCRKEWATERRSHQNVLGALLYGLVIAAIFAFTLSPRPEVVRTVFPGMLWVGISFAALLLLSRCFASDRENDATALLLSAPIDRSTIYYAKVFVYFLYLVLLEAITVPVFLAFFGQRVQGNLLLFCAILALGTLGLVSIGVLAAALAEGLRGAEILFPLLVLPLAVPDLLAAVQVTAGVVAAAPWNEYALWLELLGLYDVLFLAVPGLLFEYVMEG